MKLQRRVIPFLALFLLPLPESPGQEKNPMPVIVETLRPAARSRIGQRGLYVTSMTKLPGGDLLACPHFGDPQSQRVSIWRSGDEGRSWQRVKTAGDELFGRGAAMHCLRDGTILLHTGALYRSEDGGVRWERIDAPDMGVVRGFVESDDGTVTVYASDTDWHAGHGAAPHTLEGALKRPYRELAAGSRVAHASWRISSSDGGRTWSTRQDLAGENVYIEPGLDWDGLQPRFREASIARLSDTHVVAAARRRDPERTVLVESRDDGATWSEARDFLAPGEIHAHLLVLGDGRLLCTYARQALPRGVFAILSGDAGRTWDTDHPVQLAQSLPDFYGWPTSLSLDDGTILTSYTAKGYEESSQTRDSVTEVVRWRPPGADGSHGPHPEPATEPVFAEPHDYEKYVSGITGYTGRDLQHVAHWRLTPAQRFHIPGYKGAMSSFPDGELLLCNYQGDQSVIYRSTDDGSTWQMIPMKGDKIPGKEQALICLSDGRTVLVHTEDSDRVLYRSTDRGVTWKTVEYGHVMPTTRNFIELSDGSVLKFGFTRDRHHQPQSPRAEAWRLRSTDGGLTWPQRDEVTTWDGSHHFFGEVAILALSDTRFLASTRVMGDLARDLAGAPPLGIGTGETDNETDEGMVTMTSEDGGLTWPKPRWMGMGYSAVHSQLVRLADGRILCTHRRRFLPFGTAAVFSHDDGRTWDNDHPILLGVRPTAYGGWPTTLQLRDGTMVTCRAYMVWPDAEFEVIRWQLPPAY